MKGWGIRIQIGRTHAWFEPWPFGWGYSQSMMAPSLYGAGIWITRDRWAR